MTEARYIVGDARQALAELPAASVDLVVTSPPFLALRSYLPAEHEHKELEMGSEGTPGAFLDALLDVVVACRRVLAPHGSLCIELGDTYAGSGGAGGDYAEGGLRDGQERFDGSASKAYGLGRAPRTARVGREAAYHSSNPNTKGRRDGWPLDKSLTLIPETFRFALAYGRNPFTGRELEPWRLRNVVRWCRPNPPVGALGDKFRPATSEIAVACVARDRYFDLDGVRGGAENVKDQRERTTNGPKQDADRAEVLTANYSQRVPSHPGGAPPLDWWKISTRGYQGSHYATYPPELIDTLIKAMCPPRVCTTCGQPSRRVTEPSEAHAATLGKDMFGERHNTEFRHTAGRSRGDGKGNARVTAEFVTIGWTDCGHDTWRRGVVLDPFAGTGTTLAVATGHGHDAIGIDLDVRNVDLARERCGMFLVVEEPVA